MLIRGKSELFYQLEKEAFHAKLEIAMAYLVGILACAGCIVAAFMALWVF
jgi:hypothetical protein